MSVWRRPIEKGGDAQFRTAALPFVPGRIDLCGNTDRYLPRRVGFGGRMQFRAKNGKKIQARLNVQNVESSKRIRINMIGK
mmetsp:Transcript_18357/g.21127  ORF Transcript_18357/g.21127 Transcript_18357/m.21127 type:complete len:81 (+) Transcript_18357:573-815(+)